MSLHILSDINESDLELISWFDKKVTAIKFFFFFFKLYKWVHFIANLATHVVVVFGPNLLHRVLNVAFCQKTLKRYRALKKGSWCLSVSVTYVPLDWWGVLGAATLHYTNGLMGGKTDKKNQTEFCHILVVSNANWRGNNICANMMDLSHDPRQPVAQWGHSFFEVTFQFLCF